MLRDNINQVILVQNKHKENGRRDEPLARTLSAEAEQRLLAHYVGGTRMSDAEWFEVAWSRYLDPDLRGGTELGVDWELMRVEDSA